MDALWITLKISMPIIIVGTVLYLFRRRVSALWQQSLQQKFLPSPFTRRDEVLTTVSLGYAVCVLVVISLSDPFVSGILYVGSIQLGTLVLAIVRSRFRSLYTLLLCATLYLGIFVRGVIRQRELGQSWGGDSVLALVIFLVFGVVVPTALAWIVTLFRKDKHAT